MWLAVEADRFPDRYGTRIAAPINVAGDIGGGAPRSRKSSRPGERAQAGPRFAAGLFLIARHSGPVSRMSDCSIPHDL